ncbi:MAG: hypothetical protein J2P54_00165 [Bradyrhizobiaceae bacterium]|nr:hypothetical protein [Bradyrhizobiaceae bacterium]
MQAEPGRRGGGCSHHAHPQASTHLADTPGALDPHETLKANDRRGLLSAAENDGLGFALYDVGTDSRHPVLKLGHSGTHVVMTSRQPRFR